MPEFPQSIGTPGACSPRRPTPPTRTASPSTSTSAPSARIPAAVESVSAEAPKPVKRLSPSATAPKRSARWEIDLSPGTARSPRSETAGSTSKRHAYSSSKAGDTITE